MILTSYAQKQLVSLLMILTSYCTEAISLFAKVAHGVPRTQVLHCQTTYLHESRATYVDRCTFRRNIWVVIGHP